jgi:uncharacterized protein YdeI (YjbR/CyaY-like superfamily)
LAGTLRAHLAETIAVEASGRAVAPRPPRDLVAELAGRLAGDLELRVAFEALTPRCWREFNRFVGGATQAATRQAPVEKIVPLIFAGKGRRHG